MFIANWNYDASIWWVSLKENYKDIAMVLKMLLLPMLNQNSNIYNLFHIHYRKEFANVNPILGWKELKVVYLS